jgi:hypothetical protein
VSPYIPPNLADPCAVNGCPKDAVDAFEWASFTLIRLCQAHADRLRVQRVSYGVHVPGEPGPNFGRLRVRKPGRP